MNHTPFRVGNMYFSAQWSWLEGKPAICAIYDMNGVDCTADFFKYCLVSSIENYIASIQYEKTN